MTFDKHDEICQGAREALGNTLVDRAPARRVPAPRRRGAPADPLRIFAVPGTGKIGWRSGVPRPCRPCRAAEFPAPCRRHGRSEFFRALGTPLPPAPPPPPVATSAGGKVAVPARGALTVLFERKARLLNRSP